MPRVEFNKIGEIVAWLDKMIPRKRTYIGFYTDDRELIIQPTTSTAPVTYGYLDTCPIEDAKKKIQQRFDIPILHCKKFEWNHDNTLKKE